MPLLSIGELEALLWPLGRKGAVTMEMQPKWHLLPCNPALKCCMGSQRVVGALKRVRSVIIIPCLYHPPFQDPLSYTKRSIRDSFYAVASGTVDSLTVCKQ